MSIVLFFVEVCIHPWIDNALKHFSHQIIRFKIHLIYQSLFNDRCVMLIHSKDITHLTYIIRDVAI